MKFHLNYTPAKVDFSMDHKSSILLIGSCFAENIGGYMQDFKFKTSINPGGILFNPSSIYNFLNAAIHNKKINEELLLEREGLFYSYLHHSSFSATGKKELIEKVNSETATTQKILQTSKVLIITFGTAFIHHHKNLNQIVANCHKQPAATFEKRLLEVQEITDQYSQLIKDLKNLNPELKIIFTVSPVKYLKDGVEQNNISKSTLVLSIHKLLKQSSDCFYFPAFELVNDDLRDYRFYKEDLAHPNHLAVEYIWGKFSEVYFSPSTIELNKQIQKLNLAVNHRQMQENSQEKDKLMAFIEKQKQEIKKLDSGLEISPSTKKTTNFKLYLNTMLRTNTCGELRIEHVGQQVTLCGWVQKTRKLGGATFIDLRDRYGITQLIFSGDDENSKVLGQEGFTREMVLKATGMVIERESKNKNLPTGDIEIKLQNIEVLNKSITPPFTIEDETDGGDELRMKYRYLDLRRAVVRKNLELRHRLAIETRNYLDKLSFLEVETPVLIKSTPEGARDFVVPSRMNENQFYALPQSPQTFKQLLMVSGFDRYYQIVKCFRDEDLRADRQPEFTQIDCEMSFVEQEDILQTFEGLTKHLFKTVRGIDIPEIPRMTYANAMKYYGNDKPDTRFEMKLVELNSVVKGKNFKVFDDAELVVAICAKGASEYTRKQLDELTEWVKRPQIGATGLVYARYNSDGTLKSSVDKFYNEEELKKWSEACGAEKGDLILVLAGPEEKIRKAMSELRLEMGNKLGLRDKNKFSCLWVLDFPLLEWNEGDPNLLASLAGRWHAKHHPFTSPKPEDIELLNSSPGEVRANAYDIVINGVEVGGGSIRIHNKDLQAKMFEVLGFTNEEAQKQFGFLMNAFEFGAPPHGGIAFGFDRLCSLFGGADSIRDFIAFPKNNSGRDVMIDAPSEISEEQLKELNIQLR